MILAACSKSAPLEPAVAIGEPFPELIVRTSDGEMAPLTIGQGKLVVVNIWATWCAPCRKELPSLENLEQVLNPQRFAVIALSVDEDPYLVREYLNDKQIGLRWYLDHGGQEVTTRLGVTSYPDTYIVGPNGTLLHRIGGERVWNTAAMVDALEAAYNGDTGALKDLL
jgi:thiol-disulfide isomerase/thioredoxin